MASLAPRGVQGATIPVKAPQRAEQETRIRERENAAMPLFASRSSDFLK